MGTSVHTSDSASALACPVSTGWGEKQASVEWPSAVLVFGLAAAAAAAAAASVVTVAAAIAHSPPSQCTCSPRQRHPWCILATGV